MEMPAQLHVCTDSSGALGVASCLRADKVRRLAVRLLWLQEAATDPMLRVVKIKGNTNRAAIMAKPLASARHFKLLDLLSQRKSRSRSDWASGVRNGAVGGLLTVCLPVVVWREAWR